MDIGMDDLRCFSFKLGDWAATLCPLSSVSDALRGRTVPASLRWNQFMIGLLERRVIFFICDWCGSTLDSGGDIEGTAIACAPSFLDLTSRPTELFRGIAGLRTGFKTTGGVSTLVACGARGTGIVKVRWRETRWWRRKKEMARGRAMWLPRWVMRAKGVATWRPISDIHT